MRNVLLANSGPLRRIRLMGLAALLGVSLLAASALATVGYVWWDESRSPRLICLMYHRFVTPQEYRGCNASERIYSMPLPHFEEQLAWLRDKRYHSVTLDDAVAFARGERDLPQPAVL